MCFLNLFENTVFGRLTRSDNKVWKKLKRPVMRGCFLCGVVLILLAITLYVVPEVFKSLELIGETARVNIPVYVDRLPNGLTSFPSSLTSIFPRWWFVE